MRSNIGGSVSKGNGKLVIKQKNSNPTVSGHIDWTVFAVRHGDAVEGVANGLWHLAGDVFLANGTDSSFGYKGCAPLYLEGLFHPNGFNANDVYLLQKQDRGIWTPIMPHISIQSGLSVELP